MDASTFYVELICVIRLMFYTRQKDHNINRKLFRDLFSLGQAKPSGFKRMWVATFGRIADDS